MSIFIQGGIALAVILIMFGTGLYSALSARKELKDQASAEAN